MKIGIMQPYFLPYIGYWQLLNYVDQYVIYDDVNYIKGGWINRNKILLQGKEHYINVPMIGASSFKKINEINVNSDMHIKQKTIKTLEMAYKKSPFYSDVEPLIRRIVLFDSESLVEYLVNSIKEICVYLEIDTELLMSSSIEKDNSLKGQEKVINICNSLGATEYINAEGGKNLYSYSEFKKNSIDLAFLSSKHLVYKQNSSLFCPNLSIVDVLMNNSQNTVIDYLNEFELIREK